MTRRRGRRHKELLDVKDRRGYCHLKEEALDRTIWRNHFRGGFGPVVRQNTEGMMMTCVSNVWHIYTKFMLDLECGGCLRSHRN